MQFNNEDSSKPTALLGLYLVAIVRMERIDDQANDKIIQSCSTIKTKTAISINKKYS
jgi:hypothetical protein